MTISTLHDDPLFLEKFLDYIQLKAVGEEHYILMCFYAAMSAFTQNPLNIMVKGESSTGKTFIPELVLSLLPEKYVLSIGDMTPRAIAHEKGELAIWDENDMDTDEDARKYKVITRKDLLQMKVDEEKRGIPVPEWFRVVKLDQKILFFMDAPADHTMSMLKPILSHDKWRITYKIVETTNNGHETKTVIIEGWPAAIFCTTRTKNNKEFQTRCMLITPEATHEKFRAAIDIYSKSVANPFFGRNDELKKHLKQSIRALIEQDYKPNILIPFFESVGAAIPSTEPISMRNVQKIKGLIAVSAFIHRNNRNICDLDGDEYIMANDFDYLMGTCLYKDIETTTQTGLPKPTLDFYHQILEGIPEEDAKTKHDLMNEYKLRFRQNLSEYALRHRFTDPLINAGYITYTTNSKHGNKNVYYDASPLNSSQKSCVNGTQVFASDKIKELSLNGLEEVKKSCVNNFRMTREIDRNNNSYKLVYDTKKLRFFVEKCFKDFGISLDTLTMFTQDFNNCLSGSNPIKNENIDLIPCAKGTQDFIEEKTEINKINDKSQILNFSEEKDLRLKVLGARSKVLADEKFEVVKQPEPTENKKRYFQDHCDKCRWWTYKQIVKVFDSENRISKGFCELKKAETYSTQPCSHYIKEE